MSLDTIIQDADIKTVKILLTVFLGVAFFVGALGFTWAGGVTARVSGHDVDIAKLAVSTENLRTSVQQLSQRRSSEDEQKTQRLDRLLDILEHQTYNTPKGGK